VRSLIGLQICANTWLLIPNVASMKTRPGTVLRMLLRDRGLTE